MLNLNLLPWREWQARAQQRNCYLVFITFSLITLLIIYLIHYELKKDQIKLESICVELQQAIEQQQLQSYKTHLSDVELLQLKQVSAVAQKMIAQLRPIHQSQFTITGVKQLENEVQIVGTAKTPMALFAFVRQWSQQDNPYELKIQEIQAKHDAINFRFQLAIA